MHTDALITELASQANSRLTMTDALVRSRWNNPVTWRQPTHTVYVPAHLITGTEALGTALPNNWGHRALTALTAYGAGPGGLSGPGVPGGPAGDPLAGARTLARDLGVPNEDAETVGTLTVEKLRREPIEDHRIDFEDGFTQRGVPANDQQADEDSRAREAASVLSTWFRIQIQPNQPDKPNNPSDGAPAFAGIRMKSFDPAVRERGIRTLVLVLTGLADNGVLNNLLVQDRRKLRLTLPKVQHHSQVEAFVSILEALEKELGVPPIPFEVQIETPQAIDNIGGTTSGSEAARILAVGQDRILSLHYGTYDYSASLGIDAAEQSLEHPVADHAKNILQVCTSSVGVELSDGSTNRIPVGTPAEIFDAWQLHHRLVTRHLRRGIRQGWDLHPHHLVTRHLATIAYFRANWVAAAARLRAYTANDTSQWMDEPATAKALAGYLLRAHACGAITDTELTSTELTRSDLLSLQVTGRKAS